MIKKINYTVLMGCTLLLSLASCTDESIIAEIATPLEAEWNRENELTYNLEIEDTSSYYTLSSIIQNTHDYQFSNLYIKYKVLNDSNEVTTSNFLELSLYSPTSGKPLGDEFLLSDTQESNFVLNRNLKFKRVGKHQIVLKHQMRDNQNLSGLKSVGIQVRKNGE